MKERSNQFNGVQIKFAVGYDNKNWVTPTQIDQSNPLAPIIETGDYHGLKDADVIWLEGLGYSGGRGYFPVKVKDEWHFIVVGADFTMATSDELRQIQFAKAIMSGMCHTKNLNITPFTVSASEDTLNCDLIKQETGHVEAGEASMNLNWLIDDTLHEALEEMGETQKPTYYQFKRHQGKRVRGFKAVVNAFKYGGEVNGKFSADVTLRHQSLKHDIKLED